MPARPSLPSTHGQADTATTDRVPGAAQVATTGRQEMVLVDELAAARAQFALGGTDLVDLVVPADLASDTGDHPQVEVLRRSARRYDRAAAITGVGGTAAAYLGAGAWAWPAAYADRAEIVNWPWWVGALFGTGLFGVVAATIVVALVAIPLLNHSRDLAARADAALRSVTVAVPANVRDAWCRIDAVCTRYTNDDAAAAGTLLTLERQRLAAWEAVTEIAGHAAAGAFASRGCQDVCDALFAAAAEADLYDTMRQRALPGVAGRSVAVELLADTALTAELHVLGGEHPAP